MARKRRTAKPRAVAANKSSSGGSKFFFTLLVLGLLGWGGYSYLEKQGLVLKTATEQPKEAEPQEAEEQPAPPETEPEDDLIAPEQTEDTSAEQIEPDAAEDTVSPVAQDTTEPAPREEEDTAAPADAEAPDTEPKPTPAEEEAPAYAGKVLLSGPDCNLPANKAAFNAMVDHVLTEGDFDAFARSFNARLKGCIPELISSNKLNHSSYKRCINLVQAMDLCLLIDMAGADTLSQMVSRSAREYLNGPEAPKLFFQWALRDKNAPLHALLQSFVMNEGNPANMGYAIKTFFELWERTPERDRAKYLNLAIACSLVSPQVANSPGNVRLPDAKPLTIQQLYDYFREQDAKKKLVTDLKKLSVTQLLYVVDVRLPRSEFDWVQENLAYKQANWGDAYGSIRYRMDRAAQGVDPYVNYTFEELREEGGVCRDQGYFAQATAKSVGIPAVYIVGDGDRGPHAWVATLVDEVTWKQTGSYGYNTGRFLNSCSGRWQHENVLLNQTKKTTDEKLEKAADGMIVSNYLTRAGSIPEAHSAARFVVSSFPLLTPAWTNLVRVLGYDKEHVPPADSWRTINRQLMRHGRKNGELIDLATEVEDMYLMDGKSTSSQKSSMKRSMATLKRTVGNERSDLIVEAIERQGKLLRENEDYRGLMTLYKKELKEYTGRGDIFQQLLGQYMRFMGDEATPRQWKTLAKDVERLFEKHVRTGGGDFFKLSKEVAIQQMIADAYERGEDTKKAEKIREDAATRMQAARDRYQPEE